MDNNREDEMIDQVQITDAAQPVKPKPRHHSRREQALRSDAARVVDGLNFLLARFADLESMQLAAKQTVERVGGGRTDPTTRYLDQSPGADVRGLLDDAEAEVRAMVRRIEHDGKVATAWCAALSKALHKGPPAAVMFGQDAYMADVEEHAGLVALRDRRVAEAEPLTHDVGSYAPSEAQAKPGRR